MTDTLNRFIFDDVDVRGQHVQLRASYQEILSNHYYAPSVANLLGEFLAAVSMLSSTIKFEGSLILQVRGDGEVPLIMAEANSQQQIRAIASSSSDILNGDFHSLLGNGQLAITIDPKQGERYQGIVSLEGDNLSRCLENYFLQSEQLATKIWLAADGETAAGMLLQELPNNHEHHEQWHHLHTIASTLQAKELLEVDAEDLLYRLFHQENLRLFEAKPLVFHCSCSRQRIETSLLSLGKGTLEEIFAEQGKIDTNCEFCHRQYHFSSADILDQLPADDGITRH